MDTIKPIQLRTKSGDDLSPLANIKPDQARAFTLVELLVSMAILVLILVLLTQVIGSSQKVWTNAAASVQQFREARVAFEAITRRVSQAVLNPYMDYDNENQPTKYVRQSDLHFISGPRDQMFTYNRNTEMPGQLGGSGGKTVSGDDPQAKGYTDAVFFVAPLGYVSNSSYQTMNALLNGWGYYLDCSYDSNDRPKFLQNNPVVPEKRRFRLYEWRQPSEDLMVYVDNYTNGSYTVPTSAAQLVTIQQAAAQGKRINPTGIRGWFADHLTSNGAAGKQNYSRVIANNIIALIISPRNPGLYVSPAPGSLPTQEPDFYYAPQYFYDSRAILYPPTKATDPIAIGTANQLPPQLDITMVALDAASADRYDQMAGSSIQPPVLAAGTDLFQYVSSSTGANATADQYQKDLTTLETYLSKNHLSYQVFRTSVPIRAAKFSSQ